MSGSAAATIRRRFDLRGQIQAVGFRPFVYRLAAECRLAGYVVNNNNGVAIEIEGPAYSVEAFEDHLLARLPPLACICELQRRDVRPLGENRFRIDRSQDQAGQRPEVTPDAAVCQDCLAEMFDAADRRHRYPFINCTNCGPRYSIICTVPYDRPATTMAEFQMCPPCLGEYTDPLDRRFHAQPNACPTCGPQLRLQPPDALCTDGDPIRRAAGMLADGRILAIKGIGGYHLACRADHQEVVNRLREGKLRDGKPLAVMVPNVQAARRVCQLNSDDIQALTSPAAPIVLAPKSQNHGLAPSVAPNCRDFGIMLPYAPLHHLLFAEGLGPLVMTSGNLAGQPLTYQDEDALNELGEVADAVLMHNRRIARPIDDSVVFTFRGQAVPIRRARGYAPRAIRLEGALLRRLPKTAAKILAVGGELKSTVCLYTGGKATLSEHLGDLTHPQAFRHFIAAIDRLRELFDFVPEFVAHDLHPQYLSTHYVRRLGIPTCPVQHHHAHVVSVMAECGEAGPVIGIACDGVGYGSDAAAWGCEVLHCRLGDFDRVGHLEYFPLVGGDAAAVETWRPAAALLRQALGGTWRQSLLALAESRRQALTHQALDMFEQQASAGINAPLTSSLGRVFDAVSFLLGLCERNRHEAEAALALEGAAEQRTHLPYPYEVAEHGGQVEMSLRLAMAEIVAAVRAGHAVSRVAARFHETVARMLADAATVACEITGLGTVGVSGGCFANRMLLARLVELLEQRSLRVLYHRQVPCGDGGLAFGQAVVAAANMTIEKPAGQEAP